MTTKDLDLNALFRAWQQAKDLDKCLAFAHIFGALQFHVQQGNNLTPEQLAQVLVDAVKRSLT